MVLAVSELSRQEILDSYPDDAAGARRRAALRRRRRALPSGAPGERRRRDPAPSSASAPTQPVVLLVGTGFRRKGVDTLLEIWRREPPAGRGTRRRRQRSVPRAAHPHGARPGRGPVVFTGPRRDVERFYAAADLFALPSLHEGCPVAILEALGVGAPGRDVARDRRARAACRARSPSCLSTIRATPRPSPTACGAASIRRAGPR